DEAGTPNILGDIRAALVFLVKAAAGQDWLDRRHAALVARAQAVWSDVPQLQLLGRRDVSRLPIFSFRVGCGHGAHIHHQLFTRMLSDHYGIQARGGCACAGPYAHRLLDIDAAQSASLRRAVLAGDEMAKPGWVRLNLSAFLTDEKADFILNAVATLARDAGQLAAGYRADPATARF
ncbi:MAG: aminotransferase class V-fold PLP-dependent enzyme, partial [Paracoccus sp. (in: a-proteobacteria)]